MQTQKLLSDPGIDKALTPQSDAFSLGHETAECIVWIQAI